jgi:peptide chain release factor subunit 1
MESFQGEPQGPKGGGAIATEEGIGFAEEGAEEGGGRGRGKAKGEAALLGVEVSEEEAPAGAGLLSSEGRGHSSPIAIGKGLHFDDIRAKIGQELSCEGRGNLFAKLDDADAVQEGHAPSVPETTDVIMPPTADHFARLLHATEAEIHALPPQARDAERAETTKEKGVPMFLEGTVTKLLAQTKKSPPTLSIYLDTDASTGLWKDKLYNLEMALAKLGEKTAGTREAASFAADREKATAYLKKLKAKGDGLVIFASSGQGLWWTTSLPVRVPNEMRYEATPYVAPLAAIFDEYQRYCIAVVDNQNAQLLLAHLGEIEEQQAIESDVPKRHKQTEHGIKAEKRHAVSVARHLEKAVAALEALHAKVRFNRIIITGAAEAGPKFEKALPTHLRRLVIARTRSPLYASNAQILKEVAKLEEQFEREKEQALVGDLIARAGKHARAVIGADATLLALQDGQVFELVVASDVQLSSVACPSCGYASATIVKACPRCSAEVERTSDLAGIALKKALASEKIRTEVVSGAAREQLIAEGGMDALLTDVPYSRHGVRQRRA